MRHLMLQNGSVPRMKSLLAVLVLLAFCAASEAPIKSRPVVIELFTSEGCSSCPPADSLLQRLDMQPVPGAQIIVLSEHVDYWNDIGWKDPFSSKQFSDRQGMYAERFKTGSIYTPEMVVDGSTEFVGSDARRAKQAIAKAKSADKLSVLISDSLIDRSGAVTAHLEIAGLTDSFGASSADVIAVLALDHAESQVLHGENEGRRLQHVAVVRSLSKVGVVRKAQSFSQDIHLRTDAGLTPPDRRLVVFVQDPGSGRILGAALHSLR